MSAAIKALEAKIIRLEARVTALEHVVFQLSPSADSGYLDTIEAVKGFLRKNDINTMSPHVVAFLLERLPSDWRMLATQHGATQMFKLLTDNYSIVEARRKLA